MRARRDLDRAYDQFVATYGPINKTTFGETSDGSIIRRMPNLVKFKEDPDAMLVMSLEDYDEATGKAAKAAIMQRTWSAKRRPSRMSAVPRKACSCHSTNAAQWTCRTSPRSMASPRSRSSPNSAT